MTVVPTTQLSPTEVALMLAEAGTASPVFAAMYAWDGGKEGVVFMTEAPWPSPAIELEIQPGGLAETFDLQFYELA